MSKCKAHSVKVSKLLPASLMLSMLVGCGTSPEESRPLDPSKNYIIKWKSANSEGSGDTAQLLENIKDINDIRELERTGQIQLLSISGTNADDNATKAAVPEDIRELAPHTESSRGTPNIFYCIIGTYNIAQPTSITDLVQIEYAPGCSSYPCTRTVSAGTIIVASHCEEYYWRDGYGSYNYFHGECTGLLGYNVSLYSGSSSINYKILASVPYTNPEVSWGTVKLSFK